MEHKDVLGDDIVIGAKYIFTQLQNGIYTITIGNVVGFKESKVILNDVKRKHGTIETIHLRTYVEDTRKLSIHTHRLIPIYNRIERILNEL